MKVFITGGTGTIGGPVVNELLAHGHRVVGLARSDASAQALAASGAQSLRGDVGDLEALRAGAGESEGVVHLAFGSDGSSPDGLQDAIAKDTAAINALAQTLRGTDRPLVLASGTPWIAGEVATEEDPLPTDGPVGGRARAVNGALAMAAEGVRVSAVRIPRTAHDEGRGGFAGLLTDLARQTGVAGYPGNGQQRWPAVHAKDAAVLFRLALERAPAGSSWHAVADEGDRVIDIATVIGRRLGLPVEPVADSAFGPFGAIFATDQPASSAHTRATLGWQPTHPSLLADLEHLER